MILTILTAVTAIGSWYSARATKLASESQLYSHFIEEYSSSEMLNNLRLLRMWKYEHGENFEEDFHKELKEGNTQVLELDNARRKVKYFFVKALRLYENGFVTKQFLLEIGEFDGLHILYDVIEKLEVTLDPRNADPSSEINRLKKNMRPCRSW